MSGARIDTALQIDSDSEDEEQEEDEGAQSYSDTDPEIVEPPRADAAITIEEERKAEVYVSYDIGEKNMGFCVASGNRDGDTPMTVWKIGIVDSGERCGTVPLAARAAALARRAVLIAVRKRAAVLGIARPKITTVLLERQHVFNRRAQLIEAALYGIHCGDSVTENVVEAVPQEVAKAFCLDIGRRAKKVDAVRVAECLLCDRRHARISGAEAIEDFAAPRAKAGKKKTFKLDDMADAVLIGFWYCGHASRCATDMSRSSESRRNGHCRSKCPRRTVAKTMRHNRGRGSRLWSRRF